MNNKRVLAVIPARGGSKGIPLKNLVKIRGKSLLERTIEFALDRPEISHVCVSTDHPAIKEEAQKHQGVMVLDRPSELAGDEVPDLPVLRHATELMEQIFEHDFQTVVMLQVTSPNRTADDIAKCVSAVSGGFTESAWTVSPTDLHFHPIKQLLVDESGNLSYFDLRGSAVTARQQLRPTYHRNGACYAISRDYLMSKATSLMAPSTKAIVSIGERVNIDTLSDLEAAADFPLNGDSCNA